MPSNARARDAPLGSSSSLLTVAVAPKQHGCCGLQFSATVTLKHALVSLPVV
jgi:hypothetical protein